MERPIENGDKFNVNIMPTCTVSWKIIAHMVLSFDILLSFLLTCVFSKVVQLESKGTCHDQKSSAWLLVCVSKQPGSY